jgi:hypothetical protein
LARIFGMPRQRSLLALAAGCGNVQALPDAPPAIRSGARMRAGGAHGRDLVGRYGQPGARRFMGQLDDVTIGNRTRTDDEIAQLYART